MAKITAQDVNKLRKTTGAGMMDCKKALVETDGDFEKAIDFLRKKGQKVAAKRADRSASEGVVLAKTNDTNTFGILLSLGCETDFVAKNDAFIAFTQSLTDTALNNSAKTIEEVLALQIGTVSIADLITEQVGKIGEKIEITGYEFIESAVVGAYIHNGNKLATITGLNKAIEGGADICHQLSMQVAAMSPIAVDENSVPTEVKEHEIRVGREKAIEEGKPEHLVDRIAEGTLKKFLKENTLMNQDFVRDTKKTVAQYLSEFDKEVTVTSFKRLMLGA